MNIAQAPSQGATVRGPPRRTASTFDSEPICEANFGAGTRAPSESAVRGAGITGLMSPIGSRIRIGILGGSTNYRRPPRVIDAGHIPKSRPRVIFKDGEAVGETDKGAR